MTDISHIKGVIFDMDGVLVDSEPAMARASVAGMADFGIKAREDDFTPYLGTDDMTYFGRVAEKYGGSYSDELRDHIYDIYCETAHDHIIAFPGAAETVIKTGAAGYKTAIASSATVRKLLVNIEVLGIPSDKPDVIICGSDVSKREPDPEIFLTAASRLDLKPEECLVAEDAISGVTAAKRAGMLCFALTTTFSEQMLKDAGADMTGRSVSELSGILCGRSPQDCKGMM